MPELPDVEIFGKYLKATSLHKKIKAVHVPETTILNGISAESLDDSIKNAELYDSVRHGKYLFGALDNGKYLVFHFGMTGFLKYFKNKPEKPSYICFMLEFSNGYSLAYSCKRKLGKITATYNLNKFLYDHDIGHDALDKDFDISGFIYYSPQKG